MRLLKNKTRIQLDFTKEAIKDLDFVQKKLGAASRAEVFRRSLKLMKYALDENLNLLFVNDDGTAKTFMIF